MAESGLHLGASFDGPAPHKLLNDKKSPLRLAWPNAAEAREYARHTARIVRRSKVNFTLGGAIQHTHTHTHTHALPLTLSSVLAVFVVVSVVALLISVIANAPVIFLRLAELRKGEVGPRASCTGRSN